MVLNHFRIIVGPKWIEVKFVCVYLNNLKMYLLKFAQVSEAVSIEWLFPTKFLF